jgi:hypothetical protein
MSLILIEAASSGRGLAVLASAALVGFYLINRFLFRVPYPKGMPLLREGPGATSFSWKTRMSYYSNCEGLFREAWEKVSTISSRHGT